MDCTQYKHFIELKIDIYSVNSPHVECCCLLERTSNGENKGV